MGRPDLDVAIVLGRGERELSEPYEALVQYLGRLEEKAALQSTRLEDSAIHEINRSLTPDSQRVAGFLLEHDEFIASALGIESRTPLRGSEQATRLLDRIEELRAQLFWGDSGRTP